MFDKSGLRWPALSPFLLLTLSIVGVPYKQQTLFSWVPEAARFKVKVPADLVSGEGLCLVHRRPLTGWTEGEESLRGSEVKAVIPAIPKAPPNTITLEGDKEWKLGTVTAWSQQYHGWHLAPLGTGLPLCHNSTLISSSSSSLF